MIFIQAQASLGPDLLRSENACWIARNNISQFRKSLQSSSIPKPNESQNIESSDYVLNFFVATNLNSIYFKGQNCEEYNRINALSVFVEKIEQEKQQETLSEDVIKAKGKLSARKWEYKRILHIRNVNTYINVWR